MKPINVLFLGFVLPDEVANPLFVMDPSPAIQTHKFGWSLARALRCAFDEVTLASACPVQNYPLVNRLVFRGGAFSSQGMNGVSLGFINLIVLKHLTRFISCMTTVSTLVRRQRIDWIFIHGVHTPYLLFGLLARLGGCRMAVVLTDPPGVFSPTDGRVVRWMKSLDAWFVIKLLKRADAVLAVAPDLVQRLAPCRPALVFPGILESRLDSAVGLKGGHRADANGKRPFTIVYAGGLSAAYGVDRLVEAVRGFNSNTDVRLKLFGRGDQEDMVRDVAESDLRIVYGGFVDSKNLLPELCSADLLINPRPTGELFASLSFPSKLIEYLATGCPVLTTRITSIPEDLKVHYNFIDDESVNGIREAIQMVMQVPAVQRYAQAQAARQFARSQLSEVAVGRKIGEFIKSIKRPTI